MNLLQGTQCTEGGPDIDSQEEQISLDVNGLPDARYSELLNSNEPPLDIEAASIRPLVSRLRRRLSRYDDKISRLRAQLERLEQERATTESELSKNVAIVSPLRRMPTEILSEIFTLTLPSDREVLDRGAIDVGDSPWSLTQICGRWRRLALASSSLWSFFGIDCTIRDDTAAAYPMPLLIAQLQRAKHLRVNFLATSPSQYQLGLLQLLVLYSHRWEELYLYVIPELLPIIEIPGCFPVLHTLILGWPDSIPEEDVASEADLGCFSEAPALRNVALSMQDHILSVPLPAHQLTRYQLAGPWKRHVEILKVAKNLVEARIFVYDGDTPRIVPEGVIELRDLRRLYVSDPDILDCLRLPALEDVGFFHEESGLDPSPNVDSVASRSSCILRKLCVYGFPVADVITAILRKHQAILELAVILSEDSEYDAEEDDACVNTLISKLSARNTDGIFDVAPHLGAVFIGSRIDSGINYELCHDMLLSRWNAGALKSAGLLTAHDAEQPPPSIRCRFDDLRADGLDLLCMHGDEAEKVMHGWTFDSTPL